MPLQRKPTQREERLLEILIARSTAPVPQNWKDKLLVRPMDDGEMDSLYLFPDGKIEHRTFGEQVSDFQFKDLDGVDVIASLYVDIEGRLLELDMWKTDFSKLLQIPDL